MEAWPSTVPYATQRSAWQLSPVDERDITDVDQGPPRPRRQYTNLKYSTSIAVLMTAAQFMLFKGFFNGSVNHGADKFTMPIYDGEQYRSGLIVQFAKSNPYQASDFSVGQTLVAMNLTVHNLPVDGVTY